MILHGWAPMRHLSLRELDYAIGFVVVLAAVYVGAYYATVRREVVTEHTDGRRFAVSAYPFMREELDLLFRPIHEIDRAIRPEYWQLRIDEFGLR
jgi:hypothetical protein